MEYSTIWRGVSSRGRQPRNWKCTSACPCKLVRMAQLSDYLAAERTFLAWLRTGLALMGFGFVVARFGLFLQQLQLVQHAPAVRSTGLSLWFGTALIAAGIVVSVLSALRHIRVVRDLDANRAPSSGSLAHIVSIAAFLALVGLAMAVYLLSVGHSAGAHIETGNVPALLPHS